MSEALVPNFNGDAENSIRLRLEKLTDTTMIVHLTGFIDTYNTPHFTKEANRVIDAGYVNVVFGCSGLNYSSSTGIGAFTQLLKAAKKKGGSIKLAEIQPKVFEVFQLLGFSQFFDVTDTLDEVRDAANDIGVLEPLIEKPIFPKAFACPICSKKLKTSKPGRFRCPECRSIISVDPGGVVTLG